MRENLSSEVMNNTGVDHPAHPRSLISAFVIHLLERSIFKLASSKILIFQLVSEAQKTGLSLGFSETPKTGFVAMRPLCEQQRFWHSYLSRDM